MPPAARLGDMHVCPMVTPGVPPIPHVGGPIMPACAVTVLTGGQPQARATDMCTCVGPPANILMGSPTVLVMKMMAARMGDPTAHGGSILLGLPTVMIGGGGGGGGGSGGGGSVSGGSGYKGGGGESGGGGSSDSWDDASGTTAGAMSQPTAQANALKAAAKDGSPYCERCHQPG